MSTTVIIYHGPNRRTGDGPGGIAREGWFLLDYDPDAHGGLGEAHWIDQLDQATKFEGASALELYRRQSSVCPTRPDGKPNRPLMALTCSFAPVATLDKP